MASLLRWTKQAIEDLFDIYVLIGLEHPAAARRYFDRIKNKTTLLTDHPHLGVRRPDIRPGLRMLVEAPFVILYRIEPDSEDGPVVMVEIVRIFDGHRELARLF